MSEHIINFDDYNSWQEYISRYMSKGFRFKDQETIIIQSGERVIGQWNGEDGHISEGRDKSRLWDMLLNYKGYRGFVQTKGYQPKGEK